MPFLQRRPQVGQATQFYTLAENKTVLIVGLGNVGAEFEGTRHNIGFACLDAFAAANDFDPWVAKKDLRCLLAVRTLGGARVILCKPTTMMNLSGEAVQAVGHFYKLSPEQTVVVHDELDVPFGSIRMRIGGGSAGHNGLKSVSALFGEEFGRVRVGIGPKTPPQIDSADFVLAPFSAEQRGELPNLTRETNAILSECVFGGELPHDTRNFMV